MNADRARREHPVNSSSVARLRPINFDAEFDLTRYNVVVVVVRETVGQLKEPDVRVACTVKVVDCTGDYNSINRPNQFVLVFIGVNSRVFD